MIHVSFPCKKTSLFEVSTMISFSGEYMSVSKNRCTLKTPQKDHFLVGKPMVVGYHHFRKHPYLIKALSNRPIENPTDFHHHDDPTCVSAATMALYCPAGVTASSARPPGETESWRISWCFSSWWLTSPTHYEKYALVKMGSESSPIFVKIRNVWNHHLVFYVEDVYIPWYMNNHE